MEKLRAYPTMQIDGKVLDWEQVFNERHLPPYQKYASIFPCPKFEPIEAVAAKRHLSLSPRNDRYIEFRAGVVSTQFGECIEFATFLKYPPSFGIKRHPYMPQREALVVSAFQFLMKYNPGVKGIYARYEEDDEGRSEYYADITKRSAELQSQGLPVDEKQLILHARNNRNTWQVLHLHDPNKLMVQHDKTSSGAHVIKAYYLF